MSPEYIKEKVEQWFNIEDITKNKKSRLVNARYVYIALCRQFNESSHEEIGKVINVSHPASVQGMQKFTNFYEQPFFQEFKDGHIQLRETFKKLIKDFDFRQRNKHIFDKDFNFSSELLKVKSEYGVKLIKIIEKNHIIINNYEKKLKIHRNSDALTKVSKLEGADFKEFENLAKVFLKRKSFLPVKSYLK